MDNFSLGFDYDKTRIVFIHLYHTINGWYSANTTNTIILSSIIRISFETVPFNSRSTVYKLSRRLWKPQIPLSSLSSFTFSFCKITNNKQRTRLKMFQTWKPSLYPICWRTFFVLYDAHFWNRRTFLRLFAMLFIYFCSWRFCAAQNKLRICLSGSSLPWNI